MKFYTSVLLVSLLSAHCVIQNSQKVLAELKKLADLEDSKYHILEENKKLLEGIKVYLDGNNQRFLLNVQEQTNPEERLNYMVLEDQYKDLKKDDERVRYELASIQESIAKAFEDLVRINAFNQNLVVAKRDELLKRLEGRRLKRCQRTQEQDAGQDAGQDAQLLLLGEKLRYLLIDAEIIEVLQHNTLIKKGVFSLILGISPRQTVDAQDLEALKSSVRGSKLLEWYGAFTEGVGSHWSSISHADLARLNDKNEQIIARVREIDQRIMSSI